MSGLENLTKLFVSSNLTHPTFCHKNPEIHRTCLRCTPRKMYENPQEIAHPISVKIHKTLITVVFLFPLRGLGFSHSTCTTNHGVYGKCVRSPSQVYQRQKSFKKFCMA